MSRSSFDTSRRPWSSRFAPFLLVVASACGATGTIELAPGASDLDGGGPSADAGPQGDAGAVDAGASVPDGGAPSADSGEPPTDAGDPPTDAGNVVDAGPSFDAGAAPARFETLPPGSTLPSDEQCAAWVRRSSWEPRPGNDAANHRLPSPAELDAFNSEIWTGVADHANLELRPRITGAFTGTTDEIIQWASCKWGFEEDLTRAQAVVESWWDQGVAGDWTTIQANCPPGTWDGTGCYESYGLLQVKNRYHATATWPLARESTAFNADYGLGWRRACFEGDVSWLGSGYGPGDLSGCVGFWFTGDWKSAAALDYVAGVQGRLDDRTWEQSGF